MIVKYNFLTGLNPYSACSQAQSALWLVLNSLSHEYRLLIQYDIGQADEEVKCFEAFKREGDRSEEDGHINTGSTQELDIREEIKLLEEVKDISDELNILQSICEDQKDLLQKLFNLVAKPHPDSEGYRVIKEPVLNYYQDRSNIQLRIETIK